MEEKELFNEFEKLIKFVPSEWKYWTHNNAASLDEHFFQSSDNIYTIMADSTGVYLINAPKFIDLLNQNFVKVLKIAKTIYELERDNPPEWLLDE